MKIKKGDKVKVISGKDRGKIGTVEMVDRSKNKVIVSGVNLITVFEKKNTEKNKGGLKKIEGLISVSKLMLVEGDKPVRVGYKIEDGKRVRISKKTGKSI
jgi:large subunit ribosomal protein L24